MEKLTLNDFNGLVYRYGEKGTEAIKGLTEEQQSAVILAWSEGEKIDDPDEADEIINSYYNDFIKDSDKVEKKYIGYGYHGGGRPKKAPEDKKIYKTVSISATPDEIEKLKEQATSEGLTLSKYIINKCLK